MALRYRSFGTERKRVTLAERDAFVLPSRAMFIEAVVPAWNESRTVADAVRPLLASGAFSRVTVIDDGSTDNTADVARAAGAFVYTMPKNGGKGGAMRAGLIEPVAIGSPDSAEVRCSSVAWRCIRLESFCSNCS